MIDTRGYICPTPVLMVQKALKDQPATVEVLAEAGAAVENITRFAHSQGYQVSKTADGPDFKLTLTKADTKAGSRSAPRLCVCFCQDGQAFSCSRFPRASSIWR